MATEGRGGVLISIHKAPLWRVGQHRHHRRAAAAAAVTSFSRKKPRVQRLTGLEANAEAWERKELGDARKANEADRRAQEARRRDKEERDALKDQIVGRYADEVKVRFFLGALLASVSRNSG